MSHKFEQYSTNELLTLLKDTCTELQSRIAGVADLGSGPSIIVEHDVNSDKVTSVKVNTFLTVQTEEFSRSSAKTLLTSQQLKDNIWNQINTSKLSLFEKLNKKAEITEPQL